MSWLIDRLDFGLRGFFFSFYLFIWNILKCRWMFIGLLSLIFEITRLWELFWFFRVNFFMNYGHDCLAGTKKSICFIWGTAFKALNSYDPIKIIAKTRKYSWIWSGIALESLVKVVQKVSAGKISDYLQ